MIRNLNKVFIGDDPDNYTKEDLAVKVQQAQQAYLDLLYKQKHFDVFKKRFFTSENWVSITRQLPVVPTVYNQVEDLFIFKFNNAPIKLYYGSALNKPEYEYPHSSAVYYSSAPIYGFEIRLIKGEARFKNTAFTNYIHPHISSTDKPEGYASLDRLCVGRHQFRENIQNDRISDSNMLSSTLLDMFQWMLEVNFHDNYNNLMCPEAQLPDEITDNIDIEQLQNIVKVYTTSLLQNIPHQTLDYPSWIKPHSMTTLTIRNLAYAVLLTQIRNNRSPMWEYSILTQDINYYYHNNHHYKYNADQEILAAPLTHAKILNNTKGEHHALCFMNDN